MASLRCLFKAVHEAARRTKKAQAPLQGIQKGKREREAEHQRKKEREQTPKPMRRTDKDTGHTK